MMWVRVDMKEDLLIASSAKQSWVTLLANPETCEMVSCLVATIGAGLQV